jgi:acyl dehydratase
MTRRDKHISIERTFTQEDFNRFAALSGDNNPIHVDPVFSAQTSFRRTVSHGVLLYSILRGLVEQLLPGAQQLNQQVMFPAPTFTDEPVLFEAEIISDDGTKATVRMTATRTADDVKTCIGESSLRRKQEESE